MHFEEQILNDPAYMTDEQISEIVRNIAGLSPVQRNKQIAELLFAYRDLAQANITDPLTGLLNRDGFMKKLCDKIEGIRRREDGFEQRDSKEQNSAAIFIDLDGFKAVNDMCGHQIGDDALKEVARRLRSAFRSDDVIARIGGDELALVIEPYDPGATFNEKIIKRRIHDALKGLVFWKSGKPYPVCASIGVVLFNAKTVAGMGAGDAQDIARELLSDADIRMYGDKENGKLKRLKIARQAAFKKSPHRKKRLDNDFASGSNIHLHSIAA